MASGYCARLRQAHVRVVLVRGWFSLTEIRKNKFAHVPDSVFRKYLGFAAQNPGIVPAAQVLEKLMIMDFVLSLLGRQFKADRIL